MSQTCPYCRFTIPNGAIVCGHCGAEKSFVPVDETANDGNLIAGIIVAVLSAIFFGWQYKTFTSVLLGAVGGFIAGMWSGILTKVGRGLLYAFIGALILGFIFSLFGWTKTGAVLGAIGGFISGLNKEDEVWSR